jgi:hypothetical protein
MPPGADVPVLGAGEGRCLRVWRGIVALIFYYVGFMVAGDVADYLIGLVVERLWPQASLVIFLLLYFVFLWIAWLLAVKMTEPKDSKQVAG